jgi:hypothetical protein
MSEMVANEELRTLYRREVLAPTLAMAEQYLGELAERGLIRAGRIPIVVRALSGMVLGLALQRIMGDELLASGWDDLANQLTDLLLDGMRSGV